MFDSDVNINIDSAAVEPAPFDSLAVSSAAVHLAAIRAADVGDWSIPW
jgi:hypothetical protein